MSAHVLLNLLNELGKRDKMRGLPSILSLFRNEFNKFNNTRTRMLCPSHTHTYGLLRRVSDQTAAVRRKMRAGPNFLLRLQDADTFSCG